MRIPIAGGHHQQVLALNGKLWTNSCSLIRDGPCIVTEIRGSEMVVSTYDPDKGRGREVLRLKEESPGLNLSPDGSRIAMVLRNPPNRIRLYRLDGSVDREIEVRGAKYLTSANWASDGSAFYCVDSRGTETETLRVELDGTSKVIWTKPAGWVKPSPDGKRLALMGFSRESNAWLLGKK